MRGRKKENLLAANLGDTPNWPTTLRARLRDGRLMGTDGSVWLYKVVPLSPVVDARSDAEMLAAAEPLRRAYDELAALTSVRVARRSLARGEYRNTHLLLVNLPRYFRPKRDQVLAEYLGSSYANTVTMRRALLFGVRLKDKIGGTGGFKSTIDSVVETVVSGVTPISDFDEDWQRVDAALTRAGLVDATAEDIALANGWWNHGDHPDTPVLLHPDHVHVFTNTESVQLAHAAGVDKCSEWDTAGEKPVTGQHAITFAAASALDLDFVKATDRSALWMSQAIQSKAVAVSVRSVVEPGHVTRAELRRQKKRYIDDINERHKAGKMERAEQEAMLQQLDNVEGHYATGGADVPTLANTSVIFAFSGTIRDITQVMQGGVIDLALMSYRQMGAMAETMLCSKSRANPNVLDVPVQVVAASGAASLSFVGDEQGALVGFTERDRQPAYLDPAAASDNDALPIFLGAGATGSGKTQLALHLGYQMAKAGVPSIFVDPKALTLDTLVETPLGPVPMGDLKVGDQVIGRDGKPCNVTHKSRVFTTEETTLHELVLDNGARVSADQNHQWLVYEPAAAAAYDERVACLGATAVLESRRRMAEEHAARRIANGENPAQVEEEFLWADAPFGDVILTGELATRFAAGKTLLLPTSSWVDGVLVHGWTKVVEVSAVPSAPAQCIRVDSPDHTYLIAGGIVTHNTGSDHSPTVLAAGGQVASLDELTSSDGIFDPMRFSASQAVGVELAASMLMSVNPWGSRKEDMEVPIQRALAYGAEKGAKTTGEALLIARQDLKNLPDNLIQDVIDYAETSPMFRACVGFNPNTEGLRVSNGITLIKVGDSHLDLPEPGTPPTSISQRVALGLVRMMVFGSAMALTGRGGAVMLDEAWVFLGAGRSEVERLGRLARSQRVLPMLFTQRVSDAVDAGLSGYISRGVILPIEDKTEAKAACDLFLLEPTPERLARITAKATIGGNSNKAKAPNWASMRALRDADTGKVIRGSIGLYADLTGRAVPCEVVLPKEFLDMASTNPEDIRRREEARKAAEAAAAADMLPGGEEPPIFDIAG